MAFECLLVIATSSGYRRLFSVAAATNMNEMQDFNAG